MAKCGIPPRWTRIVLKADIATKNPSTASQADPIAVVVVPMELGISDSCAGAGEDSATGLVELSSNSVNSTGTVDHVYFQSLPTLMKTQILVQRVMPLELVEWSEPQGSMQEHDLKVACLT